MGNIQRYTAYHATDKHNVESIIKNNFTFNKSNEHWLGNGVYFFIDVALAREWGKKTPTKKFGTIDEYAIIKAIIEVDDDYVCNMLTLDDCEIVVQYFKVFWEEVYSKTKSMENFSDKQVRCAFFNWLTKVRNLKCIIAQFKERNFPINFRVNDDLDKSVLCLLQIVYNEIQMCVTDNDCIIIRENYFDNEKGKKYEKGDNS